jgi:parvulin-like peptidyl-prolyl isomerase
MAIDLGILAHKTWRTIASSALVRHPSIVSPTRGATFRGDTNTPTKAFAAFHIPTTRQPGEISPHMKTFCKLLVLCAILTVTLMAQMAPVPSHAPTAAAPANPDASAPDPQKVVARVNGVSILGRDLQEQMQRLFPYYSIHGGKVPDKYMTEIHDKAVQQLIDDELIYQAAKKKGMAVPPATMAKMLREAHKRFGSQKEYAAYAKAQYGSVEAFEKRIGRAVLIALYQDREIVQKCKISDEKLRTIYDDNKKKFVRPESVWLQTISVNVPENPSPEQLKLIESRIDEALPKAKAAKNLNEFGQVAETYSEDEYRVELGDRKWVHLVGMPPPMAKAAGALKAGETSDVVKLPDAWVILRVNEKRPEKQMEFSEVAGQLRQELESGTQKDRWTKLREQLRKEATIEIK